MAYYHPELFDPHEDLLPAAEIPDEVEPPEIPDAGPDASPDGGSDAGHVFESGGGCDCRAAPTPARNAWADVLFPISGKELL
jgi:hypothetical protein